MESHLDNDTNEINLSADITSLFDLTDVQCFEAQSAAIEDTDNLYGLPSAA